MTLAAFYNHDRSITVAKVALVELDAAAAVDMSFFIMPTVVSTKTGETLWTPERRIA
jgi:hypothetical protein